MKNKIYYGEFSLNHWLRLILTKDIILPEYQRQFVWKKDDIKKMMKSIEKDQYIPPVTIARFKDAEGYVNLILDGQQRLTSLLLARIKKMPIIRDTEEWQFSKLLSDDLTKNRIELLIQSIENAPENSFENLDTEYDDEFYLTHYLGYSYIVPHDENRDTQQAYYSSVFMTINTSGSTLSRVQSRQAMYYFKGNVTPLFKPSLNIRINTGIGDKVEEVDFPRYLALLSQFLKVNKVYDKVGSGAGGKLEEYILQYIHSVNHTPDSDDPFFGKFNELFNNNFAIEQLSNFHDDWIKLFGNNEVKFSSIIDLDVVLFGLIYYIIFKGKRLIDDNLDNLKIKLASDASRFKRDKNHSKSPNAFKYIRERMKSSINSYRRYVC